VTDPLSLIGSTVNVDGSIHTDATRPNNRLKDKNGSNFRTLKDTLIGLDYPADLIDTLMSKFKMETDIKIALERYYKDGASLSVDSIISSLIASSKGFLSGAMPEEDWKQISGLVASIIYDVKGLHKKDFMNKFKLVGIFTEAAMNVFDKLIGDDYTKQDIEELMERTENSIEDMKHVFDLQKRGLFPTDKSKFETLKGVIEDEENVIKRIKAKL
jgi:hypothetical protein